MITFTIYLIGYIVAYLFHRYNDIVIDNSRTNKDVLITLVFSLLSWLWVFLCLHVYIDHTSKYEKFKEWLNKNTKL